MRRKLVFFDIDGTLLDGLNGQDYLTEYTKKALVKLKNDGHYIFIATGRPYPYLPKDLIEYDFDGYILCDGSYVVFHDKEIAYHPIEKEEIISMFEQAKERNMIYVGYDKENAYFFNDDGTFLEFCHLFNFDESYMRVIEDYKNIVHTFTKIHIKCKEEKELNEVMVNEDKLYSADDYEHMMKEIYSKKYSKATALKEILDYTGLKLEDTYFFGDGLNDLAMMDTIGCAIAMDNANDEVKRHADYICKSVSEDGVADFIFHSGLF